MTLASTFSNSGSSSCTYVCSRVGWKAPERKRRSSQPNGLLLCFLARWVGRLVRPPTTSSTMKLSRWRTLSQTSSGACVVPTVGCVAVRGLSPVVTLAPGVARDRQSKENGWMDDRPTEQARGPLERLSVIKKVRSAVNQGKKEVLIYNSNHIGREKRLGSSRPISRHKSEALWALWKTEIRRLKLISQWLFRSLLPMSVQVKSPKILPSWSSWKVGFLTAVSISFCLSMVVMEDPGALAGGTPSATPVHHRESSAPSDPSGSAHLNNGANSGAHGSRWYDINTNAPDSHAAAMEQQQYYSQKSPSNNVNSTSNNTNSPLYYQSPVGNGDYGRCLLSTASQICLIFARFFASSI